jgi:hypothetical protein
MGPVSRVLARIVDGAKNVGGWRSYIPLDIGAGRGYEIPDQPDAIVVMKGRGGQHIPKASKRD